jgi:hypothetical protein
VGFGAIEATPGLDRKSASALLIATRVRAVLDVGPSLLPIYSAAPTLLRAKDRCAQGPFVKKVELDLFVCAALVTLSGEHE